MTGIVRYSTFQTRDSDPPHSGISTSPFRRCWARCCCEGSGSSESVDVDTAVALVQLGIAKRKNGPLEFTGTQSSGSSSEAGRSVRAEASFTSTPRQGTSISLEKTYEKLAAFSTKVPLNLEPNSSTTKNALSILNESSTGSKKFCSACSSSDSDTDSDNCRIDDLEQRKRNTIRFNDLPAINVETVDGNREKKRILYFSFCPFF